MIHKLKHLVFILIQGVGFLLTTSPPLSPLPNTMFLMILCWLIHGEFIQRATTLDGGQGWGEWTHCCNIYKKWRKTIVSTLLTKIVV